MAQFQYKARDRSGSLITGSMDAASQEVVSLELGKMGHFPISIKSVKTKTKPKDSTGSLFGPRKVEIQELVLFSRQMATLVNAGIPILGSLTALSEQVQSPHFSQVILKVQADIGDGLSLSDAMSKHPDVFSELYVSMIEAGEAGGVMDEILRRLADLLERQEQNEDKIRTALRYPKMVVAAVVIAIGILMSKVVPVFVNMFQRAQIELPLPTKILIAFHKVFVDFWLIGLITAVVGFFAFKHYIKTENGRYQWHTLLLRMPIIGPIALRTSMARFTRVFGSLQSAGVPILETLNIASRVVSNVVIAGIIRGLRVSVEEGLGLADPLQRSGYVPPLVIQMVAAGEEAGALDDMLVKVADYYDEEVDRSLKKLSTYIEPILLVFMAVLVGFLALSIFLPMWDMSKMARR